MGPSIPRIMQIQVELHSAPKGTVVPFFEYMMNDNDYVIFHKEPNTSAARGDCVEYSFLKLNRSFFQN
jgi:hypothetical protein